jgi:mono/diheme cytochrome c family protein
VRRGPYAMVSRGALALEVLMLRMMWVLPGVLLFGLLKQETPTPPPPATSIPADAATLVNPVTPTAESQARAKTMYGYDCAMCHGVNGNGKGELVGDLKLTEMKDFTDPATLKGMPDGELFYIIKNGKGKMPAEGDRAKSDEIWNMVILVRSFSKK